MDSITLKILILNILHNEDDENGEFTKLHIIVTEKVNSVCLWNHSYLFHTVYIMENEFSRLLVIRIEGQGDNIWKRRVNIVWSQEETYSLFQAEKKNLWTKDGCDLFKALTYCQHPRQSTWEKNEN